MTTDNSKPNKPDKTPTQNNFPNRTLKNWDYWDERAEREEIGCPRCGPDDVVWEEDDGSFYCENCHTYI